MFFYWVKDLLRSALAVEQNFMLATSPGFLSGNMVPSPWSSTRAQEWFLGVPKPKSGLLLISNRTQNLNKKWNFLKMTFCFFRPRMANSVKKDVLSKSLWNPEFIKKRRKSQVNYHYCPLLVLKIQVHPPSLGAAAEQLASRSKTNKSILLTWRSVIRFRALDLKREFSLPIAVRSSSSWVRPRATQAKWGSCSSQFFPTTLLPQCGFSLWSKLTEYQNASFEKGIEKAMVQREK